MLLIIEGPDGAGKTTLIERMRKDLPEAFVIARLAQYPKHPRDIASYLRFIERHPPEMRLVMDRHPLISEPIYGPILRGIDQAAGFSLQTHFSRFLPSHLNMIYCRPADETILANVVKNRQDQLEGVVERARDLISHYDMMISSLRRTKLINLASYNYEQDDIEKVLLGIQQLWRNQ